MLGDLLEIDIKNRHGDDVPFKLRWCGWWYLSQPASQPVKSVKSVKSVNYSSTQSVCVCGYGCTYACQGDAYDAQSCGCEALGVLDVHYAK